MPLSPRSSLRVASLLGAIALSLLLINTAAALITFGRGNDPVRDDNWPAGTLEVANLKTRAGRYEGPPFGGGEETFLYRGDAAAFQSALDTFAKIKCPELRLTIHDGGPAKSSFLKDEKDPKSDAHYDWSFTVWNPQSWNHLYNSPDGYIDAEDPSDGFHSPVAPPRIDVYVAGDKGGLDFSKVKVPVNVVVNDERADRAGFAGGSAVVCDVYNQITSKPVAHAKVALSTQKAYNEWIPTTDAETDAAGHVEMLKAPVGRFGVMVSCPEYASRVIGRAELRGNTLKRFAAQLAPAVTARGIVIDTAGKPVSGATVRADSLIGPDGRGYIVPNKGETKTDEQGRFEITGLPSGHTSLYVSANHFAMLGAFKLQELPADAVVLRMTATGTLKVKVLTAAGKPAIHGNIEVNPPGGAKVGDWGGSAETTADGTRTFEDVPPGEYVVSAMAIHPGTPPPTGKDPNAKTVTVKAGETTEIEVTGR